MGRPEPCVLFSQNFVHPQLDEYVDEVLFGEPIVITACEFLEQNAPSASQAVSLVGATSPPSFALEVFVQCEGETRFRRLCQPFLYSHSSSNVLEVEAVVTNHLVVRGTYRSLSLVIYGNTAEDLGQFNIELDDSSLTNLVSSAEGKLDDLPLALHSASRAVNELLTSLRVLSLPVVASDISVEVKQFVQLVLKLLELPNLEDSVHKVVSSVVKAVCSHVTHGLSCETTSEKSCDIGRSNGFEELHNAIIDGRTELLDVLQRGSGDESAALLAECSFLESEADLASSEQLAEMLSQCSCFKWISTDIGHYQLSQNKNIILGLSVAHLLCSGRESCFHFVNSGGMEHLVQVFPHYMKNSSAILLLLLGVIEQATQHSFGCEGILGWWPREEEKIPSGISKGYSQLLKLFLQEPPHDVASLATYVLHRLRFYEVAARYECDVLSVLAGLSSDGRVTSITSDKLNSAKSQLKKLLKLINLRGPVEDPSLVACSSRSLILGQTEGMLSYKSTSSLITSSNCCFSNWDVDLHLLVLLKERAFLPLSAALLSSPVLRTEDGDAMDFFIDIVSTVGAILLSLLMSRSGLIFLLQYPELSITVIDALRSAGVTNREECAPLRYASVLLSKGFVCSPQEVGMIVEMHLRVVNAIDRLLVSTPHSEDFLWVLWELCGLSRSDCGRQALLALGYFPEAVSKLIEALHSPKESDLDVKNAGASPVNLAIFHSASEIFEVLVTDSTASSLDSWIGHAVELHQALHSSSPGSNRKDAPTRLLEWIDAGAVYHKNGAIGLLRYSAVLASGGDAHLTSASILVSELTGVENVVGDAVGGSDINVMDNLGKIFSEKTFDGVTLRDSSVAQLTSAVRILAFISENSTVATALYDEGAITVIYAILINCSFMLERSSNSYDYLVDEGTECNSTSDLLLERNREQSLVDLLIPSLVLLITLLQKLQEAKEQHRNTKLMNALIRLHREVSPKLAACAADLSSPYPDSALGFGAVCHLIVSALACWPLYGWTPGLFHSLLANVEATSVLALGPKETCSLLCLLNDLFPEEGVWLWKTGVPLLSALRKLAVGTLLGPQKERQVDWYLEHSHREKLLSQLTPYLDKIAPIIQHYAISALVVIQDMLRVFVVRIACHKAENASVLLRPILSSIHYHISDFSSPSDIDVYKVYRYLDFIASLLDHPCAKMLLLEMGVAQMLTKALERCFIAIDSDGKQISDCNNSAKCGMTLISWCCPVFKSISLLFGSGTYHGSLNSSVSLNGKGGSKILSHILKFCQVLPVGKELLACLACFKEVGSCNDVQSDFVTALHHANASIEEQESDKGHEMSEKYNPGIFEWKESPPLQCCWRNLLRSVVSKDGLSLCAIEAVNALCIGSLCFCLDGKSLNTSAVGALKFLFGICDDSTDGSTENITLMLQMTTLLSSKVNDDGYLSALDIRDTLYQALSSTKSLLLLLQKDTGSVTSDDFMSMNSGCLLPKDVLLSSKVNQLEDASVEKTDDYLYLGGLCEKFVWECPENQPERLSQNLPVKRKLSSMDGAGKRIKGETVATDTTSQSAFSRGLGASMASSGPTRRDTFRQRKPNTSRPPSMHVDDYVARERSVDGVTNSNVIAVPRLGSTGGRPPSIHVDEFMARQRERQNPLVAVVGESSPHVKNAATVNDADKEKIIKSKQLKTDLDDDLQGIDIVFDGEESELDDKLPFPQPDDILQQPPPPIVEQGSPRSIVEETENDANESIQFPRSGTQVASHVDENTQSELSSRMSGSRPEMPLTREPSVSSDKKLFEQFDDSKNLGPLKMSPGFDSGPVASTSGFPAQLQMDSRVNQNFYMKNSPQHAPGSRGHYDRKGPLNPPPLPLPATTPAIYHDKGPTQSSHFVNSLNDLQTPLPTAFQGQSDFFSRATQSSPGGSAGMYPPLPPTPHQFQSSPFTLTSFKHSSSQSPAYAVGTSEFPQNTVSPMNSGHMQPSLMPPLIYGRTALYGNPPTLQQGEDPNVSQNIFHQLQPLQPPLQRPTQMPQHLLQPPQPLDQGVSLQNPTQLQHQIRMAQQTQMSSMHNHYQAQQQELPQPWQQPQVEHTPPQISHQQGDGASQQQQDLGMSLQEYFKDPNAISSLLNNKEDLCRLLEQHPKLMQMLQEKLGQQQQ